ncbi:hypothetical protein ACJ8LR_21895 [Serratia sp. CY56810]|uniref:phage tail tube protein n=1 Tax=Serratia sp. CY56810 TaxID=3383642 RepID=UPI003F9F8AE3
MSAETYYYGQGKVFLGRRNAQGQAVSLRWIGDVGELQIALTTDSFTHKESYTGQRAPVRRISTGKDGTVTATWFEHSPDNLAILLYGEKVAVPAGTITDEALPAGIQAGDRVTLNHQNVSAVTIADLVEGTDYKLDAKFGALEFLTTPATQPLSVNYTHASSVNTSVFTQTPDELFLRYEGINLAENGAAVVVELYRVQYDPASALSLINTDTSLPGLETTATVLLDTERPDDAQFGRYGRVIHVGSV